MEKKKIKKWFKDDDLSNQQISPENLNIIFGEHGNNLDDEGAKSNKFVVIKTLKNETGFSFQIVIQNVPIIGNSSYLLFSFDPEDYYLGYSIVPAASVFPPVYEKHMGLDYFDYQILQLRVNELLKESNLPEIEVDESLRDKFVYVWVEKDAYEKYLRGEQYSVAGIFAQAYFHNLKAMTKE